MSENKRSHLLVISIAIFNAGVNLSKVQLETLTTYIYYDIKRGKISKLLRGILRANLDHVWILFALATLNDL